MIGVPRQLRNITLKDNKDKTYDADDLSLLARNEKLQIINDIVVHKTLAKKLNAILPNSLSQLSEDDLSKLGEILGVILFKQTFTKVEDDVKVKVLEKIVTKNNHVFLSYIS